MKWERKILGLFLLAALALGAGCGGFQGSYGISPASFFLPGFGEAKPQQTPNQHSSSNYLTSVESVEVAAQGN